MTHNTEANSDPNEQPVSTEYITFDRVAEKTWQVIVNEGFATIVIDLLTEADPGPAKCPEIRLYLEEPHEDIAPESIRRVFSYSHDIIPTDNTPDAIWKPNHEHETALVRIPHGQQQLPIIEVTFNPDNPHSKHTVNITVKDISHCESQLKGNVNLPKYETGDILFTGPVNTKTS